MARGKLGTLTVDLVAATGGFTKGMTQAQRETAVTVRRMKKDLSSFKAHFGKVFKTLGVVAAAGIAAIGVAVKDTTQEMADMYRAAIRVGTTVKSFSSLAFAAHQVGLETQDLRDALNGLYGVISGAVSSATSAQALGLKKLGISARTANGQVKDTTQLLYELAKAYQRFKAQGRLGEFLSIGDTLSSGDMRDLLPLLALGADRIMAMQKNAVALGYAFSKDDAQAALKFSHQMTKLHDILKGVQREFVSALLPALSKLADKITALAMSGTLREWAQHIAAAINYLIQHFREIAQVAGVVIATIAGMKAFSLVADTVRGLAAAFKVLRGAMIFLVASPIAAAILAIGAALGGLAYLAYKAYKRSQKFSDTMHTAKQATDSLAAATRGLNKARGAEIQTAKESEKQHRKNALAALAEVQAIIKATRAKLRAQLDPSLWQRVKNLVKGGGPLGGVGFRVKAIKAYLSQLDKAKGAAGDLRRQIMRADVALESGDKRLKDYHANMQKTAQAAGKVKETVTATNKQSRFNPFWWLKDALAGAKELASTVNQLTRELATPSERLFSAFEKRAKQIQSINGQDRFGQRNVDKLMKGASGLLDQAGGNMGQTFVFGASGAGAGVGQLGGFSDIQARIKAVQDMRKQLLAGLTAYHEKGLIEDQRYEDARKAIKNKSAAKIDAIHRNSMLMQVSAMSNAFGQMAGLVGQFAGEQSAAYKSMYAISKGFAVAQAVLMMWINISKAMSKGYPENIAYIAAAIAQGTQIVSTIKGLSYGGGRATGGPVQAGTAYTVGERGRETFVPNVPGVVLPNDDGKSRGYYAPTVNIDARGAGPDEIAKLANMRKDIINEMKGQIGALHKYGHFMPTMGGT